VETLDSNNAEETFTDGETVSAEETTGNEEEEVEHIHLPNRYGYGNRSFGLYAEAHPDPVEGKYLDLMLVYTNNYSRTQAGVWTSVRFGMNAFFGPVTAPDFGDGLDLNENYYSVEHDNSNVFRVFTDIEDDQVFVKDLHYPELMRHPGLLERFSFGGYLRGTIRSGKLFQTHKYRYQLSMEHIPKHRWYQASQTTDNSYIAVQSKDGDKVLKIAWEEIYDLWFQSTYFTLCLHAGPYFGTVEPGQSVTRRGRNFFVSKGGYEDFKSCLEDWEEVTNPTPLDEPKEDPSESVFEEVDARLHHYFCGLHATH